MVFLRSPHTPLIVAVRAWDHNSMRGTKFPCTAALLPGDAVAVTLCYARSLKRSMAETKAARIPGSMAEWPASGIT
jgi:hypothetical protein